MRTQGTNGALRVIVVSVVGDSHRGRSRVVVVGVVVAVVIAVATIPTSVGIFFPCTCSASIVGIGTKFV